MSVRVPWVEGWGRNLLLVTAPRELCLEPGALAGCQGLEPGTKLEHWFTASPMPRAQKSGVRPPKSGNVYKILNLGLFLCWLVSQPLGSSQAMCSGFSLQSGGLELTFVLKDT